MNKVVDEMVEFIENEINENNKYFNAIACDGDFAGEIIVHFVKKDGKEKTRYKKVVRKALDLGALVKSTCPATLSVTLRYINEYY